jgi:hypothetical protein
VTDFSRFLHTYLWFEHSKSWSTLDTFVYRVPAHALQNQSLSSIPNHMTCRLHSQKQQPFGANLMNESYSYTGKVKSSKAYWWCGDRPSSDDPLLTQRFSSRHHQRHGTHKSRITVSFTKPNFYPNRIVSLSSDLWVGMATLLSWS